MSLFLERFILALLVALAVALMFANPFKFDRTQRITLMVAVVFLAYFVAHTAQKANRSSAKSSGVSREFAKGPSYRPEEIYQGTWGKREKGSPLTLTAEPIRLRLDVTHNKVVTLKNMGTQYVKDLGLKVTECSFQPSAFARGHLVLSSCVTLAGGGFARKVLAGQSETNPMNFGAASIFLEPLAEGSVSFDSPRMTKYVCFRITFRDPRSSRKYVLYRVTSIEKTISSLLPGDSFVDTSSGQLSIEKLHFIRGIIPMIEDDQDKKFNDGAEHYDPESPPLPSSTSAG